MGLLKKILGIDNLKQEMDKGFTEVEQKLKTSWNWINYLHELEQENKSTIEQLKKENTQLKELMKDKTEILQVPHKEVPVKKQEQKFEEQEEEPMQEEPIAQKADSNIKLKKIDISGIGQKEAYILQILYQLACFDQSSSIRTSKIHENLPYNITTRGLRKKLYKLQEQGIINSVMYGNTRKWFLDMNKITKVKQFLAKKA